MPVVPRTATEIPAGHTPVESSAMKSFKYDPKANEIEILDKPGHGYVYGDVSPEQGESFSKGEFKGQGPKDDPSFGRAWGDLRKAPGVVQTNKIINGKRILTPRTMSDEDMISPEEWEAAHALGTQVEGSPRQ